MAKFGFIGTGNMGGALVKAVCKKIDRKDVFLTDHTYEKAETLSVVCGAVHSDTETIAKKANYIFLGAKPQKTAILIDEIKPYITSRKKCILVTMAAGLTVKQIQAMCGFAVPVIRIMPNTPVAVGEGMILCCAGDGVTATDMRTFKTALSAAGILDEVKEEDIDAASILSGCAPAYIFQYLQAMVETGRKFGLDETKSALYVEQMMRGAATLAMTSKENLETLKKNVCSPGGSTIEGVKVFDAENLGAIVEKAMTASLKRTVELGQENK